MPEPVAAPRGSARVARLIDVMEPPAGPQVSAAGRPGARQLPRLSGY